MKNVTVLYFAALRELTGTATEKLTLPDHVVTVDDFTRHLVSHTPTLASGMPSVRVAKNEAFAARGELISDGDVLALIPPVQGG